jgi:hypothetical protein
VCRPGLLTPALASPSARPRPFRPGSDAGRRVAAVRHRHRPGGVRWPLPRLRPLSERPLHATPSPASSQRSAKGENFAPSSLLCSGASVCLRRATAACSTVATAPPAAALHRPPLPQANRPQVRSHFHFRRCPPWMDLVRVGSSPWPALSGPSPPLVLGSIAPLEVSGARPKLS